VIVRRGQNGEGHAGGDEGARHNTGDDEVKAALPYVDATAGRRRGLLASWLGPDVLGVPVACHERGCYWPLTFAVVPLLSVRG
jgi:hypothetical protein